MNSFGFDKNSIPPSLFDRLARNETVDLTGGRTHGVNVLNKGPNWAAHLLLENKIAELKKYFDKEKIKHLNATMWEGKEGEITLQLTGDAELCNLLGSLLDLNGRPEILDLKSYGTTTVGINGKSGYMVFRLAQAANKPDTEATENLKKQVEVLNAQKTDLEKRVVAFSAFLKVVRDALIAPNPLGYMFGKLNRKKVASFMVDGEVNQD